MHLCHTSKALATTTIPEITTSAMSAPRGMSIPLLLFPLGLIPPLGLVLALALVLGLALGVVG